MDGSVSFPDHCIDGWCFERSCCSSATGAAGTGAWISPYDNNESVAMAESVPIDDEYASFRDRDAGTLGIARFGVPAMGGG